MKNYFSNLFLLSGLFTTSFTYAGSIDSVQVPSTVENRTVVPFNVYFNPPLEAGDYFYLKTGDDKYVMQVTTEGSTNLSKLSGRFKAMTNEVKFVIVKNGNIVSEKMASFHNIDGKNPDILEEEINDNGTACRYILENKDVKMLCKTIMSKSDYINKVEFSDAYGKIVIKSSPYVSQNPFFGASGSFNPSNLNIKVYTSNDKYTDNSSIQRNGSNEISNIELFVKDSNDGWLKSN